MQHKRRVVIADLWSRRGGYTATLVLSWRQAWARGAKSDVDVRAIVGNAHDTTLDLVRSAVEAGMIDDGVWLLVGDWLVLA